MYEVNSELATQMRSTARSKMTPVTNLGAFGGCSAIGNTKISTPKTLSDEFLES